MISCSPSKCNTVCNSSNIIYIYNSTSWTLRLCWALVRFHLACCVAVDWVRLRMGWMVKWCFYNVRGHDMTWLALKSFWLNRASPATLWHVLCWTYVACTMNQSIYSAYMYLGTKSKSSDLSKMSSSLKVQPKSNNIQLNLIECMI